MATAYLGMDYESSTPRILVESVREWRRIEYERDRQRAVLFGLANNGQEIPDYPEDDIGGRVEASSFFI